MDLRNKPKSYWKEKLDDDQFRIMREGGTEYAFTGKFVNTKTPGVYTCGSCGTPLFESKTKYDSGSGWPSFYESKKLPNGEDPVEYKTDNSHGMSRTEALCRTCGAHLGHVFPDGPKPTGQRYCINSLSLGLKPDNDEEPK